MRVFQDRLCSFKSKGVLGIGGRKGSRHEVSLSWNPGGPIIIAEKMAREEDDIPSH